MQWPAVLFHPVDRMISHDVVSRCSFVVMQFLRCPLFTSVKAVMLLSWFVCLSVSWSTRGLTDVFRDLQSDELVWTEIQSQELFIGACVVCSSVIGEIRRCQRCSVILVMSCWVKRVWVQCVILPGLSPYGEALSVLWRCKMGDRKKTSSSYQRWRLVTSVCLFVCLSVCPRSNRKTAWAVNTKLGTRILYSSRFSCIDPEVRRSRSHGYKYRHGGMVASDHVPYSITQYARCAACSHCRCGSACQYDCLCFPVIPKGSLLRQPAPAWHNCTLLNENWMSVCVPWYGLPWLWSSLTEFFLFFVWCTIYVDHDTMYSGWVSEFIELVILCYSCKARIWVGGVSAQTW